MQVALLNMCSLLNGSMPTQDPYGATYTPPIAVRAVTAEASAQLPEVVVKVEMGRSHFGTGMNHLNDSADGLTEYRGFRSESCTFSFEVLARNNAERYAIADAIFALIPAGYAFDSAGNATEGVILYALGENGIIADGWEYVRFPDTDLEDPRFDGQVFSAELALTADIWSIWTTQPGGVTQVDIKTSFVPFSDPTLPPSTTSSPGGVLPLYTDPTLPVIP
jgi:hypothetical protein